ncbi:hypothetical protein AA14337_0233 [Acetobacter malorum DSM 14337]|uniref:Putative auto-transporter adhesin head GIN domain-containing protein n=1 Tax=Acetobacter malorum DSM 14337 TaxID=1307910 RepID=A0ABQ0PLT3_9PROT|nr:DUF2807 domain-containing protein [Acetobacter malorum]GBQ75465.1 hypothetical protein AA14337_0233 [Acetobacter malorum DSM 14337]
MIRGITMIALGGAALSALCFGTAASRGPVLFPATKWTVDWTGTEAAGPTQTRTLDWQGSNALTLNLPAQIIYKQGDKPSITVRGSEKLVERVSLKNNTLDISESKSHHIFWRNSSLTIIITAPALNTLTLNGFGSLDLQNYQQPHLDLTINGAASVKAHGHTDSLKLAIDGAASVNLSDLTLSDLDLSMDGAGSVKAGPTGRVKVSIDGAGSVKLTNTPQSLAQRIDGIGSVSLPHDTAKPAPKTAPQSDKDSDGEENEDLSF